MATVGSNKAKIAKRVIEVLEFFDEDHREATVMDIVRRYSRPQSSTSELLSSLVDLGLLYKDNNTRSYRPTPRAAMLGGATQPSAVREGRLTTLMDRLAAQTGLCVGLFGIVDVRTQIFSWRRGKGGNDCGLDISLGGGRFETLTGSAAGWMLLATQSKPRREGIVRRLNSEAEGEIIPYGEMVSRIDACEMENHAIGPVGFGSKSECCVMLLPADVTDRPLALGFVYKSGETVDRKALIACLREGIDQLACTAQAEEPALEPVRRLHAVA